jgi:hypothetical protein
MTIAAMFARLLSSSSGGLSGADIVMLRYGLRRVPEILLADFREGAERSAQIASLDRRCTPVRRPDVGERLSEPLLDNCGALVSASERTALV